MRARLVAPFILLVAGCATARGPYPLNLEPEAGVEARVRSAVAAVAADVPARPLERAEELRVLALRSLVLESSPPSIPEDRSDYVDLRDELARALERGVVSAGHVTRLNGRLALHELAAGYLDLPLDELRGHFDPARDWGRRLAGYLGGELAIDAQDSEGRPVRQRERMVLSAPWYAAGAPDLDMSKHEIVERGPSWERVLWLVVASENLSVYQDVGTVTFRSVPAGGRERTLVVFDSIHDVDPGPLGSLLPARLRSAIALGVLRATFEAHVESYRQLAAAPR